MAVFGDVSLPLSERLTASAGLRLTHEDKEFKADFDSLGYDPPSPGMLAACSESGRLSDDFWTGKAALSCEWSPDLTTHASIARGYKSGGNGFYNTFMGFGVPREPVRGSGGSVGGNLLQRHERRTVPDGPSTLWGARARRRRFTACPVTGAG
ncbi:TonB-dependent receptor [Rhodobacter capsulatus]|uniref:TonB-dependent receptor n=1 Tax=Rhodobacter capsulatus TaxID=1061 RepID=A0A4U1JLK1_RHOCA|nr:TonB-dependent receptor [Rhodobacter capsulatus]TKD14460.1 TonB-dependent receptor [Rhodobacter capsulatus]